MLLDLFDDLYRAASGRNPFFERIRLYSVIRFFIRYFANVCLPFYFSLTGNGERFRVAKSAIAEGGAGLIVSLTTFPGRIDTVWLAVESLLRQSVKPDAIILWLSTDQFKQASDLPKSLIGLIERGLRIEFREGDLRSHKKYFYARKEFPNATVVLADDDIFYPTTMLKSLIDLSRRHEGRVICRFSKRIKWAKNGQIEPYIGWEKINEGVPREDIFFGSGGGVLIPPGAVHGDLLNEEALLENCPLADDIWLNAMCRLVSSQMVSTATPFSLLPVINIESTDLSSINNGQLMNDRQLRQVRSYCEKVHGVDPFGLRP